MRWVPGCRIGAAALVAALATGCAQVATVTSTPARDAFTSGLAPFAAFELGHTYAAALLTAEEPCLLSLFDQQRIAAQIYPQLDRATLAGTQELLKSTFTKQRNELARARPGIVRFESDGGEGRVVLPAVEQAVDLPLRSCPDRDPRAAGLVPEGNVEGTLTIEFPDRRKRIEVRARLSGNRSVLVSVPVLRDVSEAKTFVEAPALVPQP